MINWIVKLLSSKCTWCWLEFSQFDFAIEKPNTIQCEHRQQLHRLKFSYLFVSPCTWLQLKVCWTIFSRLLICASMRQTVHTIHSDNERTIATLNGEYCNIMLTHHYNMRKLSVRLYSHSVNLRTKQLKKNGLNLSFRCYSIEKRDSTEREKGREQK